MPITCLFFFCVLCGKVSVLLSAFTLLGFGCVTNWGYSLGMGKRVVCGALEKRQKYLYSRNSVCYSGPEGIKEDTQAKKDALLS